PEELRVRDPRDLADERALPVERQLGLGLDAPRREAVEERRPVSVRDLAREVGLPAEARVGARRVEGGELGRLEAAERRRAAERREGLARRIDERPGVVLLLRRDLVEVLQELRGLD